MASATTPTSLSLLPSSSSSSSTSRNRSLVHVAASISTSRFQSAGLRVPLNRLGFSAAAVDPLLALHVAAKIRGFKGKGMRGVVSMAKKSVGDLTAADLKGKKVLVRADLNVPLDDNQKITDDNRIRAAIPTIKHLIENGAKVILSSHLGRPKGVTPKFSLAPLVPRLSELLGIQVQKADDCIGPEVEKMVAALPEGGVLLLENVRFYKEEEKNEPEFAKNLASLADLYVNDAFGTAHRAHASTEGVTKFLKPSVAGFLLQKELDYLVGAVSNPKRPFAAIVGGSKVSSKIGVIESLLEKCDILLLGGGMIFTFYKAQGISAFPRDRVTGLDKERLVAKGNKLNIREDNQVGSPGIVTKGKASRAPRTGSVMLPSSSPNIPRTPGSLEGWEQPTGLNKVQSMGEANNRKRPMPAGSSSPPMAQWVGQRPQKISRTRRANLVSPVSNQDEAQISSESLPATDFGARITSNGNNGSLLARGVVNNTQQFKMKLENISSPARLSESEESGAGENKLKEKGMDASEVEDKPVNAIQKVGSFLLPTKKSKILTKEETGDGVRRQGRSGRGSSLSRTGATPVREKLENPAMPKPVRGMRPGSDKNESKSGRPPSKKLSDRKAFSRSGHVLHGGSSDFTGESDDDHEELLLAAASARDANYAACSGLFWKKTEPIFASVGSDDASYLKEQLCFAEELDESLSQMFGTDNILDVAALSGKAEPEQRFDKVTPLYQRVLSALIEEDIIEGSDNYERRSSNYQHNGVDSSSDTYIHGDVELKDGDQVESEIESEADLQSKRRCSVDRFSCNGNAISNSFRSPSIYNPLCDEPCQGDDGLLQSEVGVPGFCPNSFVGPQHVQSNISSISSFDCQYQQLSLDDKLLLELQSIGLYPESVPDLTEGEEDTMNQDIIELKQGLYKQAEKKKMQLGKIDKGIKKEKEVEGRNLEQVAMNKLIEMAYKKYMACRGINASKSGVSKISKQVAMAFVKRSLARYRKFEETGRSSFDEPALRATIFAAPSFDNGAASVDCVDPGAAANSYREAHNCRFDPRASGALTSMLEQPHIDNLDMGSSAAYQALSYSSDQPLAKQEPISNRVKKREVLLDDVGGSTSVRATSALGNTFLGGAKGKRSERDRDQNKDMLAKNSVAKAGRPSLGSFRGERKTKTKPKQKIAQLSTSGNGLLGRHAEKTHLVYPSVHTSGESMTKNSNKVGREVGLLSHGTVPKDSSKDTEEPVDFTNLQMNELDPIEELGVSNDLGGPQDLSSWLNFDEDGLQDHDLQEHDSVGLEIPMDDLSELNMLM